MWIVAIVFLFSLHVFRIAAADENKFCDDPGEINNGHRFGTDFTYLKAVRYECDEGYKLKGSSTLFCQASGLWNGSIPSCEKPCSVPEISNGIIGTYPRNVLNLVPMILRQVSIGTIIEDNQKLFLHCFPGFEVSGSQAREDEIFCNKGMWSRKLLCEPAGCTKLPSILNLARTEDSSSISHGSIVKYTCKHPYVLSKPSELQCLFGVWTGELPQCEDSRCYVKDLKNSSRISPLHSPVFIFSKDELQVTCETGYTFKGMKPFCLNGKWIRNLLSPCQLARCHFPPSPSLGSVSLSGKLTVGTLAAYSCDEGTTLVGSSTSKCLENGGWTFEPPKCLRSCKIPEIRNGNIGWFKRVESYSEKEFVQFQVGEAVVHGGNVILKCDPDFMPVSLPTTSSIDTDEVSSCNDGEWSKPLECKKASCFEEPPIVENGNAVVESRNHGDVIWYFCNRGFRKLRAGNVECEYGTWKGILPICGKELIECSRFNAPDALKVSYSDDLRIGSIATFSCLHSYVLLGNEKNECLQNGSWKYELPICEESIFCPRFNAPDALKVSYSDDIRIGSIATFSCLPSYRLLGKRKTKCLKDGSWKYELPKCQSLSGCSINKTESPHLFADPLKEHYSFGELVSLSCSPGYMLTTAVERVMCLATEWSDPLPGCAKIR